MGIKVDGAFCQAAIRGRARYLPPYKADFRWYRAVPSQKTGSFPRGNGSGFGYLGGGIRYFICNASGMLFSISQGAVEISARGFRHIDCSARIGGCGASTLNHQRRFSARNVCSFEGFFYQALRKSGHEQRAEKPNQKSCLLCPKPERLVPEIPPGKDAPERKTPIRGKN